VPPLDIAHPRFYTEPLCNAVCSEVIMDKHLAQSSGKQALLITRKRATPAPSREEVSRCINIWANVYGLRDEAQAGSGLRLPSRPWIGRKLGRIE
jgi:hypothetical protein